MIFLETIRGTIWGVVVWVFMVTLICLLVWLWTKDKKGIIQNKKGGK